MLSIGPVSVHAFSGNGNGSEQKPYEITTCAQLDEIRNAFSSDYELKNNIDCNVAPYNSGEGFDPLGDTTYGNFNGTFKGNGYTISNLYINRPDEDRVGLFGFTDGGQIKNLKVIGANITGKRYVGVIAGQTQGSTKIEEVYASGIITGKPGESLYIGGMVGWNVAQILKSYADVTVSGRIYVGGLTGNNTDEIEDSYATGNVTGDDTVGGLAGINIGSNALIKNSYATGSITGTSTAGGFVGRNTSGAKIQNSYSTGAVSGSSNVGGFVGSNNSSIIENSYWDVNRSGQISTSGDTSPINTSGEPNPNYWFGNSTNPPMQSWDFTNTWQTNSNAHPTIQFPAQIDDSENNEDSAEDVGIPGGGIAKSGIDLNASTIEIAFTPELDDTPSFSCFGSNTSPVTKTLSQIGVTDPDDLETILNQQCLQQAGDYIIDLTVFDRAGNGPVVENVQFTITASDPELNMVQTSCDNAPYANGSDACYFEITIKDRFQNPVTQITSLDLGASPTYNTNDDANELTKFHNGLFVSVPTISNGKGSLSVTSKVPSLGKIGDHLAQVVQRIMNFSGNVPEITSSGNTGSSNIPISQNVGLTFHNLFAVRPEGVYVTLNKSGEDTDSRINFTITEQGTSGIGSLGEGFQARNKDITHVTYVPQTPHFDSFPDVTQNSWVGLINLINDNFNIDTANYPLSLTTAIDYVINGTAVRHPAGGAGLHGNINDPDDPNDNSQNYDLRNRNNGSDPTGAIGYNYDLTPENIRADIEGGILGDIDDTFNTFDNAIEIGAIQATDLRENIVENAVRLSRGVSDTLPSGDFANWFTDKNVVVVTGDVTLSTSSASINMPTGKNTLIIKDGNLIIADDMQYQNNADSVGFILINSNPGVKPAKSNIFVRSNVKNIVGTYYADGAIMTNDGSSISTGNPGSTDQLLLQGTLYTNNTLGGFFNTRTPWGDDSSEESQKYDLHYVRRYNGSNGTAAPGASPNPHAFVIRVDGKAIQSPPPGFTTSQ